MGGGGGACVRVMWCGVCVKRIDFCIDVFCYQITEQYVYTNRQLNVLPFCG